MHLGQGAVGLLADGVVERIIFTVFDIAGRLGPDGLLGVDLAVFDNFLLHLLRFFGVCIITVLDVEVVTILLLVVTLLLLFIITLGLLLLFDRHFLPISLVVCSTIGKLMTHCTSSPIPSACLAR